ncbi:hypothetical protein N7495_001311 [Penicillium taxi]|uniref:uncharacterized protein n=1 Tax=Penicillium taxi TaxID=168475 RepID=UPI00254576A0|nr:uncharacterized protein N7495_001311 [Penicillium taxi]KAJ5908629.1 hypothetical protein N7495_001311 [Penicillium taxi]
MAALTMTPTRQPFASLDSPRVRPLMQSRLNRQNQQVDAILSAKKTPIFTDAENIDPLTQSLSSKRKRTLDDVDEAICKGSPKPLKTSRIAHSPRVLGVSPRSLCTPLKTKIATPKSAPIPKPAGRSPPPKSSRSIGRSVVAKSRTEQIKRGVAAPFSLATALSKGRAAAARPKPQPKPTSWFFEIHVDSEQEEMTNIMQHSTDNLDLNAEGKISSDGRGKENVPPAELGIDLPPSIETVALAAAAAVVKTSKMDEDRVPLGELDASDYAPADSDSFPHFIVHDDSEKETGKVPGLRKTLVPSSLSIASVLEAACSTEGTDKSTECSAETEASLSSQKETESSPTSSPESSESSESS